MAGQSGGTVVIGLGNPILSDDGIGWQVAKQVRQALDGQWYGGSPSAHDSVHVMEACVGGLSLAFRRVPHAVEAYAMRVTGSQTLVYSSDCEYSEGLLELATGADMLLAEAT